MILLLIYFLRIFYDSPKDYPHQLYFFLVSLFYFQVEFLLTVFIIFKFKFSFNDTFFDAFYFLVFIKIIYQTALRFRS